jgi:ketosteroid isomerase-like protein
MLVYSLVSMTTDNATTFAAEWAEAWNRRDIEYVLAHFHEDVEFTSPTALAVMGVPTVRGKTALREYWATALGRLTSLRFTVDRVVWDASTRELAIIYTAEIDGKSRRVSENLRFNEADRVVAAEVFHGIAR